jgi:nucleotide-binding universal stress UspA family protein
MSLEDGAGSDGRFSSYVESLASVTGHADRVNPLRDYCTGLTLTFTSTQEAIMSYKTILVHCDASPRLSHRLEVAVDLALRFGAHLVGFHVQVPMEVPAFSAGVIPTLDLFAAYEAVAKAGHDTAAAAFEKSIKGSHLSTEWRVAKGYHEEELVIQARYADLLILGQTEPEEETFTPGDLPETVAISSGSATLVVPYIGIRRKLGKSIMLCWNASRESARATAMALPFFVSAEKVIVLIVDTNQLGSGHGPEPGADVAAWLARHGINVTVQREVAAHIDVGDVILSRAADHDIDLIVMGLYGHSRAREVILGGASRTLLSSMTVPVLMAH